MHGDQLESPCAEQTAAYIGILFVNVMRRLIESHSNWRRYTIGSLLMGSTLGPTAAVMNLETLRHQVVFHCLVSASNCIKKLEVALYIVLVTI